MNVDMKKFSSDQQLKYDNSDPGLHASKYLESPKPREGLREGGGSDKEAAEAIVLILGDTAVPMLSSPNDPSILMGGTGIKPDG